MLHNYLIYTYIVGSRVVFHTLLYLYVILGLPPLVIKGLNKYARTCITVAIVVMIKHCFKFWRYDGALHTIIYLSIHAHIHVNQMLQQMYLVFLYVESIDQSSYDLQSKLHWEVSWSLEWCHHFQETIPKVNQTCFFTEEPKSYNNSYQKLMKISFTFSHQKRVVTSYIAKTSHYQLVPIMWLVNTSHYLLANNN